MQLRYGASIRCCRAATTKTAREHLRTLVVDHPDFVEGLRLLAATEQTLGDTDTAETLLRRAVAIDPHWTPVLAALGELLLVRGRHEEAEHLLARAAQRFAHAALVLSRHYNATQRPALALATLAPFCTNGDADAELATQHVAALAALGRIDEAVAGYRRLLQATPDNPRTAHALAIALDAAARHDESERVAAIVLSRGHRTASAYFTHARSLIALRDFTRAETALRDALRLQPRLVEAHDSLARLVWMRTGDVEHATAALNETLRALPDDESLLAAKAAVLQGAGDARSAYRCLAALAERAQATPSLLVRAGLAALEFDSTNALHLAERALRAAPASTPARSVLVAALLGVGDARAALAHCDALLATAPDDQYLIALQTTAWRLLGDERYTHYCDYARLAVPFQLEPPPGWRDGSAFLADVRRSLESLHDPDGHALLFQSLRNGTETTDDLARNSDPTIQALFRAFAEPIRAYLARVGRGADPLRRRNDGSHRFNGSWSVRLRNAGFHHNHVHPRGWISSAFYVDLPDCMNDARDEGGTLTFGEPGILTTPALRAEHSMRPQVGMLVLFPSYFWHGTLPFASAQTRLTVAFDVVPAR